MKLLSIALGLMLATSGTTAFAQKSTEGAKATTNSQPAISSKASDKEEVTAEQEKKIKAMLKQTKKSFEAAELTAEQQQQAEELFAKPIKSFIVKRDAAKITPEMQKKHAAAMKAARSSGKSNKEQSAAAFAEAGLDEEQIKVFKTTQAAMAKAKRDFAKSLTAKQVEKLPEAIQKMLAGGK